MTETTKELVVTEEEKELMAMQAEMQAELREEAQRIDSSDIVMAKVLTMQGMSQLVLDGKAKFGDFVHSISEEVLGDISKGITITPLYYTKVWMVLKSEGGEYKYSHVESFTQENAHKFGDDVLDGVPIKRKLVYKLFAFLGDDTSMPVIIDFKGVSAQAGKQLITQAWSIGIQNKEYPFYRNYILAGNKEKKDQQTFVKLKVGTGEETSPAVRLQGYKWFKTLRDAQNNIKEAEEITPQSSDMQF